MSLAGDALTGLSGREPIAVGPFAALVALHWAFFLAFRALPHTPGHDGVRLFLPAFGVLAVLAGLGAAAVVERWGRWGKALVVAAIVEGVASVAVMMPVPLSYFSPVVGGLPGAPRLGMEPTYFWDGLSDEAIDWLNAHTPPGSVGPVRDVPDVAGSTSSRRAGSARRLPRSTRAAEPGTSSRTARARSGRSSASCSSEGRPAFVVSKLGVPLVLIYPLPGLIDPCRLRGRDTTVRAIARALGPSLVAGVRPGLARGPAGHGADRRRHRPDLGRAVVPDQPARLGPVVGGAGQGPDPGRPRRPARRPTPCSITGPTAGSATTSTRPWPAS